MAEIGICAIRAVLLASLTLFLAPGIALAQLGTPSEPFTVSVDPLAPAAGGTVTFTPISGDIDIAGATMTVSVNGTQIVSGTAEPFSLRVGGAGQTQTVTITMKTAGCSFKQVASITPQDVVLIVEPLASAPPLYPGRPLIPVGGSVRLVAVADLRGANGVQLDPANLAYTWSVDGSGAGSGVGKRTIIVNSPLQYRANSVTVTVTSPDGTLVGSDSVDLSPGEPVLRIYERDPLMGVRFEKALSGTFTLPGSEATLYATPFSYPTALSAPSLAWYVAGALAQRGSSITLRPTGNSRGTASLSVTGAQSGSIDAPTASVGLTISFGSAKSSNIFGL